MVLAGAFFSWSTLLHSGLEQPLVQAVVAQPALGIWCKISVSLYLAVIIPGVWVLLVSTRIGFWGDAFSRGCNTWLDSGYMLCVSTLLTMEEFHTFSSLR